MNTKGNFFFVKCHIFSTQFSPVSNGPPLKKFPGRVPAAGEIFFGSPPPSSEISCSDHHLWLLLWGPPVPCYQEGISSSHASLTRVLGTLTTLAETTYQDQEKEEDTKEKQFIKGVL